MKSRINNFEDVLENKYPQKWWLGIITTFGAIIIVLLAHILVMSVLIIGFRLAIEVPPKDPNFSNEMMFAIVFIGLSFLLPIIAIFLYRKFVQKLPIITLFSATKFRPRLFVVGVLVAFIAIGFDALLSIVLEGFFNIHKEAAELLDRITMYGMDRYLILIFVYAVTIAIQSSAEELFFRSFLMQHMRRTGANILIATIITTLLFCSGHIGETVPMSALFAVFIMGLAFQIGSNISQGIEAAMGAHITNNFILIGVLGLLDNSGAEDLAGYISGIFYFVAFLGAVLLAKRLWPEDFLPASKPLLRGTE